MEGGSHPSTIQALSSQGAIPRHGLATSYHTGQATGDDSSRVHFGLGSNQGQEVALTQAVQHKGYRDWHPKQPDVHDAVILSLEAIRKSEDIHQSG